MKNNIFQKIIFSGILLLMIPVLSFGIGVGIYLGYPSAGLSLKMNSVSATIAASYNRGLIVTGDYWFLKSQITDTPLNYYIAGGAYVGIGESGVSTGIRIPFGVQWYFIDHLETFLEVTPGLSVIEQNALNTAFEPAAGLGIRYHF